MDRIVMCFALVAVVGCQKAQQNKSAAEPAAPVTVQAGSLESKAMAAKEALFKQLSGRLMEVMSDGGPAAAIGVCSQEASEIATKVGEQQGVKIGRTALKLRNSKNLPPDWARSLMSEEATEPQFVSVSHDALGALLPIKLQPQCMTCHGPKEALPAEVKEKLTQLYPNDSATGFQTGDLRGWFWVEVPTSAKDSAVAAGEG